MGGNWRHLTAEWAKCNSLTRDAWCCC